MRLRPLRAALAALLAAAASLAAAQGDPTAEADERGLPLWEVGVGVGGLAAPAYLGSAKTRSYLAPWPYVIYRGERLRANREGVGIELFDSERVRLDLSFNGALPVKSSDTAREGMENLPLVLESGAVLKIALAESSEQRWQLRLPLRYATGISRHGLQRVGWIADPTLRRTQSLSFAGRRVDWGLDLAVKFQDQHFNDFYYGVGPEDVRPGRPAYESRGGYAGTTVNTGLFTRSGRLAYGAFVGYANLAGARFADSPLVDKRGNWYGGFAIFWVLDQSARPARATSP